MKNVKNPSLLFFFGIISAVFVKFFTFHGEKLLFSAKKYPPEYTAVYSGEVSHIFQLQLSSAIVLITIIASSGSSAPKTALPATKTLAPAEAATAIVLSLIPPST